MRNDDRVFAAWGDGQLVSAAIAESACRAWGGRLLGAEAMLGIDEPVSGIPADAYRAGREGPGWWTGARWVDGRWVLGDDAPEVVNGPWCTAPPTPVDALPGFDGDIERWGGAVAALRLVVRATTPDGCYALPAPTEPAWVACERDR